MSDTIPDDTFARHIVEIGNASITQIEAARAAQTVFIEKGVALSLGDILVQQGVLTQAIRENIEKKLRLHQQGGLTHLGGYKLIRKLGEGGMGAVFLAEDKAQQKFAIKVLSPRYASDAEFLRRFQREGRAAAKLKHANIISAVDVGEDFNTHFYVMEYCEGEPLDVLLKREHFLPVRQALKIVIDVARGLKHAHDNSIIHRDIKPANIFISFNPEATLGNIADGVARILDLGLSKSIGDAEQSFRTETGVIMGTPHYISPEQANSDRNIDGRTDIYSLGATLYHLVTGETPFQADSSPLIIMKHLTAQLPNPQDIRPEIPDGVPQVLQKMMAKLPQDRYLNCAELLADLERVARGEMPTQFIDEGKSSILASRKDSTVLQSAATTRAGFRTHTNEKPPAGQKTGRIALLSSAAAAILCIGFFALRDNGTPTPAPAAQPAASPRAQPAEKTPAAKPPQPPATPKEPPAEIALDLGSGVKLDLVLAKAGEFEMGSDRFGGEGPPHRVRISQPFYIGKYEVTVAQFRAFADAAIYKSEAEQLPQTTGIKNGKWEKFLPLNWRNPGFKQDDTHPACAITWNDAQAFCKWTSEKTGKSVRLPTEAEWEYVARGPNGPRYAWGELWEAGSANVADKSLKDTGFEMKFGGVPEDDSFPFTAPVGSFKRTKTWCGAFDLAGNVWEWVDDGFAPYTSELQIDPKGPAKSADYIIRGGSWNASQPEAGAGRRVPRPASDRSVSFGFRIAVNTK